MKASSACATVFCLNYNKRVREENQASQSCSHGKRSKKNGEVGRRRRREMAVAWVDLERIGNCVSLDSIRLEPGRPYSIGRSPSLSQLVFDDARVSRQHCQMLLDSSLHKLYLLDGVFSVSGDDSDCIVEQFRNRALASVGCGDVKEGIIDLKSRFRASLNGVFVNGNKVNSGSVVELLVGDEVSFVDGIGFVVKRISFQERDEPTMVQSVSNSTSSYGSKRIFPPNQECISGSYDVYERANLLLKCCKRILRSKDPISYIRHCSYLNSQRDDTDACNYKISDVPDPDPKKSNSFDFPTVNVSPSHSNEDAFVWKDVVNHEKGVAAPLNPNFEKDPSSGDFTDHVDSQSKFVLPPGKKFCLNLLGSMQSSGSAVSLRELLHPVQSISRIFIATFTNDILWFLSYCKIPSHLPVTLVCHNAVKCWSADVSSRYSVPYPEFPNLAVVHPPFPEAIAFGKDSRKQGVACHHPKLLILQREDSIRIIVSSANLNEKQWKNVTNTVWWQDFPLRNMPDYSTLFTQICDVNMHKNSNSDFAAQLAGFMAHLLTDVPSQVYWITELCKYDFSGAKGYLIASVPGIHSYRGFSAYKDMQFLHDNQYRSGSSNMDFIGSVEASVVGLGHLFRRAVDSKGVQLKKLATILRSYGVAHGLARVVLRRNKNIPADVNAVSVLVSNPEDLSEEDCVQLGFLPRNVAKWVSPLWDIGFFGFTGYISCEEALTSALQGKGIKVQLVLHVSKGPHFQDISDKMLYEHIVAISSLIGSLQRSTGLWRLEEVLHQYHWPEHLESDFVYGASSIGSVDAKFIAAFSSAAGKRSVDCLDSEESDPEWGRWNISHELKNPSIRIAFPTIERVKNAHNGVLSSRYVLCMAERTWQRLKPVGILRDAVPYPNDRIGHPMHTKVARRRFESNKKDGPSFGWVYSGSHNFSAAAWGRQLSSSRLHVCNYELGMLFVYPPPESRRKAEIDPDSDHCFDDIVLPFLVPAPRYGRSDRPATMQAMREAFAAEKAQRGAEILENEVCSEIMEDEEEDEEGERITDCVTEEKCEEKAYADILWSQVESS